MPPGPTRLYCIISVEMTHRLRQIVPTSPQTRERLGRLLPPLLLLAALSTLFLFGSVRGNFGHFYRPGIHNWNSSQSLALAENLSPSHNFRLFHRLEPGKDGATVYALYSRFPIGSYALIKLAIFPFGDDLSAKILAGRILMLLLFSAAAVLAYLSLCRLTSNHWIALSAVLVAFSSYYLLYYSDKISNEVTMDLFAVMLTFHGMIVFVQEGRFRQILVKTCIALLLGWHVYAFLAPFVILGMGRDLLRAHSSVTAEPVFHRVKRIGTTLLGSRYLMLGIAALLFGVGVLGFNIANEYTALNGETSLSRLPSVESMIRRAGLDEGFNVAQADNLAWHSFLVQEFRRIGRMSIPFYVFWGDRSTVDPLGIPLLLVVGIAATGVCLVGLAFVRHRILFATLALSGFFWTLPLRHSTAFHDFESVFHVGVLLVVFSLALLYANKMLGNRTVAAFSAVALLIFVGSAFQTAQVRYDAGADELHKAAIKDFQAIRKVTRGKSVFVASPSRGSISGFAGAAYAVDFYLAGSLMIYDDGSAKRARDTDFIITRYRDDGKPLVMPKNRIVFLYESVNALDLYRSEYQSVVSEDPVVRSNFDVYLDERTLTYVSELCDPAVVETLFFLHVTPFDHGVLSPERRQHGFDNLDFLFYPDAFSHDRGLLRRSGRIFDGKCMVTITLPNYPIASVSTGQYDDDGRIWGVKFYTIDDWRVRYDAIVTNEPAASSVFDVYLEEDELTYIKEPCGETDTQHRFFLHVRPIDRNDLPRDRRQHGFDNLDFDFTGRGPIFDGKCMVTISLPDYLIAGIATGQFGGDGRIWSVRFDDWRVRYDAIVTNEPAASSVFDMYLGGNELTYLKEPCAEADTQPRFFLHVRPIDRNDLPEDRRQHGFNNLDFDFAERGKIFDGKCMASITLPDYPGAGITTGQFTDDGQIWKAEFPASH